MHRVFYLNLTLITTGAAIYQPENLLKLPNVSFEGLLSGHKIDDVVGPPKSPTPFSSGVSKISDFYDSAALGQYFTTQKIDVDDDELDRWLTEKVYSGAVYRRKTDADKNGSAMWELYNKNTGHLGVLDHPDQVDRLHGMHKFTGAAVRV